MLVDDSSSEPFHSKLLSEHKNSVEGINAGEAPRLPRGLIMQRIGEPMRGHSHLSDQGVTMNSGQNKNRTARHSRPTPAYANRSNRRPSNPSRSELQNPYNARRNYERYLTLAQAEVLSGNVIGAENYYQHAEHYLRMMSSDEVTS